MPKKKSAPRIEPPVEHWQDEPEEHDYPAAAAYLSLIRPLAEVKRVVVALKKAPLERRRAKDLLRASGLALLPTENAHVAADLAKVTRGSVSPRSSWCGATSCAGYPSPSPTATSAYAPATISTRAPTARATWPISASVRPRSRPELEVVGQRSSSLTMCCAI
jgi:hypothetical protein